MLRRHPGAAVALWILLLGSTLGFASCGAEPSRSTDQSPAGTSSAATILATSSTATTWYPMTTSAIAAANSREAMKAALQLGDSTILYLGGGCDLAAVQSLVSTPAREGLARMLSSLGRPTHCQVWSTATSGRYDVVEVGLVFADGYSRQPSFDVTVVFDSDTPTIADVASGSTPGPYESISFALPNGDGKSAADSSPRVIEITAEPKFQYLVHKYSYYTAEAVVLGTVIEELPLRLNPLAPFDGSGGTGEARSEHQPVVYKGYSLEVNKAFGPETIPGRIVVYALGNGTVSLDGAAYEVHADLPLDAGPGDRLFVPLTKVAYFGTPQLEPHEYWVQANWAVFAVDESSRCTRVTGVEIDPESGHEFSLSELEGVALGEGKTPSLIE